MPTPAGDPLRKVTLNLYEEDCLDAEKLFGRGWTTELRSIWHEFIYSRTHKGFNPKRLEDLPYEGNEDDRH